jgi:N-methylhydantoinase A
VSGLARRLGLSDDACAEGILAVSVQQMVGALRRVSVERGADPREMSLMAFGGAGPLHACAVADELGVRRVLAPRTAGVLCALGLLTAGERRDWALSVLAPVSGASRLSERLAPLADAARREMPGAAHEIGVDCRYAGQSHSITVPWHPPEGPESLARAFHLAHRTRLGDADEARAVEAVTLRLAAVRPGARPHLAGAGGEPVAGPAVMSLDGATLWVAPGWRAAPGAAGLVVLDRGPA